MIDNNLRFLKRLEPLQIGDFLNNGSIDSINDVKLYEYLDEYLLVFFFSTACNGCLPVIETLKDFIDKYPNANTLVLFDSPIENVEFLKEYYSNKTTVYQMKYRDMEKGFNVSATPSIFLLNSVGQILFTEIGHHGKTFYQIEKLLLSIVTKEEV